MLKYCQKDTKGFHIICATYKNNIKNFYAKVQNNNMSYLKNIKNVLKKYA